MASQHVEEASSAELQCKTWVLKVSLHCEGCRRKVKKTLQSIDGVFTVNIEAQQQKVTVTGNVEVEILIKKLTKAGKHGELWPEKLDKPEKKAGNTETNKKEKDIKDVQSLTNEAQEKPQVNFNGMQPKGNDNKSPEKPKGGQTSLNAGKKGSEAQGSAQRTGGKKKKKGHKENDKNGSLSGNEPGLDPGLGAVNLSPTRQQFYSYPQPQGFYFPPVFAVNHNTAYPNKSPGPFYCVPPFVHMYGNGGQDVSFVQDRPSGAFDIFSDENVNGCFVM